MTSLLLPISGVEYTRRSGSPSIAFSGSWTGGLFTFDFGVDNVGRNFGGMLTSVSYTFGIVPNSNSWPPPNTWATYDASANQGTWSAEYSSDNVNWHIAMSMAISFLVSTGNSVQTSGTRYNIANSSAIRGGSFVRYWRFALTGGGLNGSENLQSTSSGVTLSTTGTIVFPSPSFGTSWVYT